MEAGPMLKRLSQDLFVSKDPKSFLNILAKARDTIVMAEPIEKKLRKLEKQGKFREFSPHNRLQEALDNGWINQEEFALVTDARKQKRDVIMVDDFDMKLKNYDKNLLDRVVF